MKVLFVGLGSIAKKHLYALRQLGDFEVSALRSSRDSPKWENVNDLYSLAEVEKQECDFFLISNPTASHFSTLKDLARLRKPLFIEKPLFSEVGPKEKRVVMQIVQSGIPTYVGCSLRFLDSLKKLRELIEGSRINEVNSYSGSYLPDWRPNTNFRNSYSANETLGGGVHIDLIHELDYLYWIFGMPQRSVLRTSRKSSLEINAVDYANYLWEYESFNASIILNYYRRDSKRTLEVVCEEGTFSVDLLKNKIYFGDEEIYSSNQKLADTFTSQMEYFLHNVVKNKKSCFNSIEEAYKVLELCLKT